MKVIVRRASRDLAAVGGVSASRSKRAESLNRVVAADRPDVKIKALAEKDF
jgi:hypothetical protein